MRTRKNELGPSNSYLKMNLTERLLSDMEFENPRRQAHENKSNEQISPVLDPFVSTSLSCLLGAKDTFRRA